MRRDETRVRCFTGFLWIAWVGVCAVRTCRVRARMLGWFLAFAGKALSAETGNLPPLPVVVPAELGGPCAPPPVTLQNWWPGDGNASDIQSSANRSEEHTSE